MKKLLFALIAVFSLATSVVAQEENVTSEEILLDGRDKETDEDKGNGSRSIVLQPVSAYLSYNVVSVTFEQPYSAVTVTVVSEATGSVVYSETCSNPTSLLIDLSAVAAGNYRLLIETNDSYWEGSFSL